jgi:hypothetical protein
MNWIEKCAEFATDVTDNNGDIMFDVLERKALALRSQLLASKCEEVEREINKLEARCTCSCNFGDGCLCKEERTGYNRAIKEIELIIRTILK